MAYKGRGTVQLRLAEHEHAQAAAAFVAELVRQGVVFDAREEVGESPSGLASEPVLVVNFSGGF